MLANRLTKNLLRYKFKYFRFVGSPRTRSTARKYRDMQLRQVGESYPIHACVCAEDILHESAECANRIRPSALHVTINSTNTIIIKLLRFI
jgi:hypothetical protein